MFWNLNGLKLATLIHSIKALSAAAISSYANFLQALDQLSPSLDLWLQQPAAGPEVFACEAFCHTSLADQFPSLAAGAVPPSVSCVVTISPLMDMLCLQAWSLFLDSICSNSKAKEDIPTGFVRQFGSKVLEVGDFIRNIRTLRKQEGKHEWFAGFFNFLDAKLAA
jgi:hypothetical protein